MFLVGLIVKMRLLICTVLLTQIIYDQHCMCVQEKAKIRTVLHLIAYISYCGFQAVKISIFRIADSWFCFAQIVGT